jgi:hypothetical protein
MTLIFLHHSNVILVKKDVPPETPCWDLKFAVDLLALEEGCPSSEIHVELVSPFRSHHTPFVQSPLTQDVVALHSIEEYQDLHFPAYKGGRG